MAKPSVDSIRRNPARRNPVRRNRVVTLRCSIVPAGTPGERAAEPVEYLHGHGNLLPAIEAALEGNCPGDRQTLELTPEEAYGERLEAAIVQVPRSQLDPTVQVHPGERLSARGPNGLMEFTLIAMDEHSVTLDGNHPLAGQALDVSLEVLAVRPAHPDEIRHRRPHPGGHHLMVGDSSWQPE